MLKRLQSLELPMTHINHWWPLFTAYECVVMMILPLHHYLTYSCDTNAVPGVTYTGLFSSPHFLSFHISSTCVFCIISCPLAS